MAQVESCTQGVLLSGSRTAILAGVSIDSRTLSHGDLFFAIRGPRHDGHEYVPEVLGRGAAGAVVAWDYTPAVPCPDDRILIKVKDTHQALKDLAADIRNRWHGSLIGITGSMGKTTAKEYSAHVLQAGYAVYRSPGNFNNLFGLPLALCRLRQEHDIGIFEMGMSSHGEIAEMCRMARPEIGVITNVAPVHLEFFSGLEDIAAAKGELAGALGPSGTLIYCDDDPLVAGIAARFEGKRLPFGIGPNAAVRAADIEIAGLAETRFNLITAAESRAASVPFAGFHHVMNALPAVALGLHFGIEAGLIIERLRSLPPSPMRGQVLALQGGLTVIDDSYNSNPQALRQMIDTVCALSCCQRRVVVAGEMLELGPGGDKLHYDCGAWAARRGVDILVAVRGTAGEIARGAIEAGMPQENVRFFSDVDAATTFVAATVQPGDLVLVKASRGVQLDRMVRSLCTTRRERKN